MIVLSRYFCTNFALLIFKIHTLMHIGHSKALYMIIRHCHLLYMYPGQVESNKIKKVTMDFVEQRISFDLLNMNIWEFIIGLAGFTVYKKKTTKRFKAPDRLVFYCITVSHIVLINSIDLKLLRWYTPRFGGFGF